MFLIDHQYRTIHNQQNSPLLPWIVFACPPTLECFSYRVTSTPDRFRCHAQPNPAHPPPTTRTFLESTGTTSDADTDTVSSAIETDKYRWEMLLLQLLLQLLLLQLVKVLQLLQVFVVVYEDGCDGAKSNEVTQLKYLHHLRFMNSVFVYASFTVEWKRTAPNQ
jgi:hypothetical protein